MIPSDIDSYYKLHSKFYDLTRWAFLFGRNSLPNYFPILKPKSRILDLGCGTGKHLNQLKKKYKNSEIIGLDQSEAMISKVKLENKYTLLNQKYSISSFPENHFDLILCSYSLTMFEEIEVVIKNIRTHLKPNRKLLVVDFDSTPYQWFSKWMKKNHVSFEPNLFKQLLKQFELEFKRTNTAYISLYDYTIYVMRNKD